MAVTFLLTLIVLRWKLVTGGSGLFGKIDRLGDYSARNKMTSGTANAFICGDTPLKSGVHAWRVTVNGLDNNGGSIVLGIVQAGKNLSDESYNDYTLFAIETVGTGLRRLGGIRTSDSGFAEFRSGDKLDFVLDVDHCVLTVITLKDGRRCSFNLPIPFFGWLPHFHLYYSGNEVSIELITPARAGKQ